MNSISDSKSIVTNSRGSMLPYVLGWVAGVPVSILFLVAILRSVF